MRYSINLQAGVPQRQPFRGKCVVVMSTGAADEVDLTLLGASQQDPVPFGLVGRNFSAFAPGENFSGAELVATVACVVQLLVTAYQVQTLDGANLTVNVNASDVTARPLLTNATAIGAGASAVGIRGDKTYQATGATTAGAGSVTVEVQGSNDGGATWSTLGTIPLTLSTTSVAGGFSSGDRFALVRGNVTAIGGTGAHVSLFEAE